MKQYRATLTINVFIDAESEDDANQKSEDMAIFFRDDEGNHYDSDLIDVDIEEVID